MVPDYESLMLPLLTLLGDGRERTSAECRGAVQADLRLSVDDLAERIPTGANLFSSRMHWAATYLVKAGVLQRPRRGTLQITERGRSLLSEAPTSIDTTHLAERYEEMRSWRRTRRVRDDGGGATATADTRQELSPEEAIDSSYQQIRDAVEADILERAMVMPPDRFEKLVLDLLLRLGYGGPFGSSLHMGRSGDGGVDGVIKQDKLGLELIYVQAKRWQGSVGSSVVREFAGSLSAHRARRGVIITTSTFSPDARRDAERMGDGIVLVDGRELARLMYDVGLGVTVSSTYELKRPDTDYFESPD